MAVFTEVERVEVWDRRQTGESNRSIGRRLGRSAASIRAMVESTGGVRPAVRRRSTRHLSLAEREEISRGIAAGEALRLVARRLGRAPSTVSRELARNGGRWRYRAHRADQAAWKRARRPQPCKLAENPQLRRVVEDKLVDRWSPQQISGWLVRTYPDDEGMHVDAQASRDLEAGVPGSTDQAWCTFTGIAIARDATRALSDPPVDLEKLPFDPLGYRDYDLPWDGLDAD